MTRADAMLQVLTQRRDALRSQIRRLKQDIDAGDPASTDGLREDLDDSVLVLVEVDQLLKGCGQCEGEDWSVGEYRKRVLDLVNRRVDTEAKVRVGGIASLLMLARDIIELPLYPPAPAPAPLVTDKDVPF